MKQNKQENLCACSAFINNAIAIKERRRVEETHQRVEDLLSEFQVTHEANKLYDRMEKKLLQGKEKAARPEAKMEAEIQQYETRLKIAKTVLPTATLTPTPSTGQRRDTWVK